MPFGSNNDAIAAAARRADARLDATIADVMMPDETRLDDRLRVALRTTLNALVAGIEADSAATPTAFLPAAVGPTRSRRCWPATRRRYRC